MEQCGSDKAIQSLFAELVTRRSMGRKASDNIMVRTVQENSCGLVEWLLKEYRKQFEEFVVNDDTLGRVEWSLLKDARGRSRGLEGLLLWCIENEAPQSVLEALWRSMDDPVHAALIAANVCRETADSKHNSSTYKDGIARRNLETIAERFERLAVFCLDDLAKQGRGVEYLFDGAKAWHSADGLDDRSRTLFFLAYQLKCKAFVH